jgi:hypothetical protein
MAQTIPETMTIKLELDTSGIGGELVFMNACFGIWRYIGDAGVCSELQAGIRWARS